MKKRDPSQYLFLAAAGFLIFCYGVAVPMFNIFPNRFLIDLRFASMQLYEEVNNLAKIKPTHYLQPARYDGQGVTRLDAERASPGLTLLTGFFEDTLELRLIELDGSIVNRWPVKFFDLFPDPTHIMPERLRPATDWNTEIHGAVALPDGSVVFNFEYNGSVMLDRCGQVAWRLPRMTHHSVAPASDGGLWISGRRFVQSGSKFAPLVPPYAEDTVLKVSADGDVISEFSVPALFQRPDLWALLLANGQFKVQVPQRELVHLNDVEELTEDIAPVFPQFAVGDLMLSMRELNLIMVVDPAGRTVKWHRTGPWFRQHDPDFQPDGTITVFSNNSDNTSDGSVSGGSQILTFDPSTSTTASLYGADRQRTFYTETGGKHQVLDNGNVLIAEYEAGRVFEVDPDGNLVWEYVNRYSQDETAKITEATRYAQDYFAVSAWACE